MDEVMTKAELDRYRKISELLDIMWPYTQRDMILRHEHRRMESRCQDMITMMQRELGYMAVYPIVDGCSREAIFEGSPEACRQFVKQHKEVEPEDEVIVLTI